VSPPWSTFPIVDGWINHVPPDVAAAWLAREDMAPVIAQFHRTKHAWGQTSAELVADMDKAGVAQALLTTVPHIHDYGSFDAECDSIQEVIGQYPGRFFGLPFLDPGRPTVAARNLRRAVTRYGFAGARIFPAADGIPPNDRRYYVIYTVACELGVPITVNVGIPGPRYPADPARPLHLDDVCRDFPELQLVATHMGHPWHDELIALMVKYPNLHLMTSAWAPRYYPAAVLDFLRGRGRSQVMFASDHPLVPLDRCMEELSQLPLDQETWQRFLVDNAVRVFALAARQHAEDRRAR
jgi:uncharacterized protein